MVLLALYSARHGDLKDDGGHTGRDEQDVEEKQITMLTVMY